MKNQPSTATPTAVALVAKSFVYLPSTDKLLTPQISSPTASPSNTNGKTGSMTSPPLTPSPISRPHEPLLSCRAILRYSNPPPPSHRPPHKDTTCKRCDPEALHQVEEDLSEEAYAIQVTRNSGTVFPDARGRGDPLREVEQDVTVGQNDCGFAGNSVREIRCQFSSFLPENTN